MYLSIYVYITVHTIILITLVTLITRNWHHMESGACCCGSNDNDDDDTQPIAQGQPDSATTVTQGLITITITITITYHMTHTYASCILVSHHIISTLSSPVIMCHMYNIIFYCINVLYACYMFCPLFHLQNLTSVVYVFIIMIYILYFVVFVCIPGKVLLWLWWLPKPSRRYTKLKLVNNTSHKLLRDTSPRLCTLNNLNPHRYQTFI